HTIRLSRYGRTLSRAWEVDMDKVAVACQGGGMHAAFEVGVLTEILKDVKGNQFELVGLSGTSAGALCVLMVWYGLAPKNGRDGSVDEAIRGLERFWEDFVAKTDAETLLNRVTYETLKAEEEEILGVNAPVFASLNPYGAIYKAFADCLPSLGVRKQYFDLKDLLAKACPEFDRIEGPKVKTRVLIGASEVVNGFETVFDSDVKKRMQLENRGMQRVKKPKDRARYWRQRLPLSLPGVAASGTLPALREAERVDGGYYWDGLYSQNPPVREFLAGTDEVPDELWIVRINPQQWPHVPKSNKDIQDRQNELMGNLSLNKELDFIMTVNAWNEVYKGEKFAKDHKHVTVRTIKMEKKTADHLAYSSKFNRSHDFMEKLRDEGQRVAQRWLGEWKKKSVKEYPEDAAF